MIPWAQADHTLCSWLKIVDMRLTKSMRVMNNALKIAYFGLNISIKLNEMLIRAFMVFFRPHEPLEVSPYEITFGRRPRRGEKKICSNINLFCSTRQRPETFHQKALISCTNNYFGGSIKLVVIGSM